MVNGSQHPISAEAKTREQEIHVPDSVRIRCPLVSFKLRKVDDHCPDCPHFRGLVDRFPGSTSHAFVVRYAVMCVGEPVKRELQELEG